MVWSWEMFTVPVGARPSLFSGFLLVSFRRDMLPKQGKQERRCYFSGRFLEKNGYTLHEIEQWKLDILLMEEILHQLIGSLSHCFQGFIHPRWCRISSINSSFIMLINKTLHKLGYSNHQNSWDIHHVNWRHHIIVHQQHKGINDTQEV